MASPKGDTEPRESSDHAHDDHGHEHHEHDEHDHEHHDHDEHGHEHHDHDEHGHEHHDHGHEPAPAIRAIRPATLGALSAPRFSLKPPGRGHDHGDHSACDHDDHGHDHEGHDHSTCGHDHHGHDHHGHDHHDHAHEERAHGTRAAEDGGQAVQLDLDFHLPGETDELGRFEELAYRLKDLPGVSEVHRRTDLGHPELCIHYDDEVVSLNEVLEAAREASEQVRNRYRRAEWFVREMVAPQCGRVIEYSLRKMEGILQADVAFGSERLIIEYDSEHVDEKDVEKRVEALGHYLDPIEHEACQHHHHGGMAARLQMPLVVTSGVLIAIGFALELLTDVIDLVPTILYAVALVAGGFFSVKGAVNSIRQLRFDIETLMILAGVGAAVLGAWLEGAFLLFLFSLGHALEHKAMARARNALSELGKLRPEMALVERDGDFVEVDVYTVERGDRVLVRPGDRVPLDGVVRDGESSLDQSAVTGESIPVPKKPGDEVFAGTLNADSALEIEVTKRSTESVISKLVDLVAQAEARKSPTQRLTQTIEEKFVPIVLAAAVAYPIILLITGMAVRPAVLRAVSLLVAASPCALAISVPAAVLSAVAAAARRGVLFKGGVHIEELSRVQVMAFDKTGTLTVGEPHLTAVEPLPGSDESTLLATAAAAESLSSHPLARAVIEGARERGIDIDEADQMSAIHGKGIRAQKGTDVIEIGNRAMFEGTVPDSITAAVERLHDAGQTTMIVKRNDDFLGVIAVADTVRPEARATIAKLKELGIEQIILLTGDNARVAKAIGEQVGISEIHGPLLPAEKVETMKRLARDQSVGMVGDGINDAPALASASVGIAMGGAGTDIALETADIVLMADKLDGLPGAVSLARKASRIIRQNLVIALGVAGLLVIAVIAGWAQVSEAIVLHEGSTIVVALNGIRLLRG